MSEVVKNATSVASERDFYKVLLVGASGKGKTYSFRNMNPETTGFINVENKPLPFKNNFKYHKRINTYTEVYDTLIEYAKNPDVKVVVIDSLSAFMDLVLAEARKTKKGFDVWNFYNEEITKFNTYVKRIPKEVFVTAHYEILNIEGDSEKRVKAKGKEWEGMVEKDYTIVMYADNKFNEKKVPSYFLNLASEGTSAKCPPDIFGPEVIQIENDANMIYKSILDFVN